MNESPSPSTPLAENDLAPSPVAAQPSAPEAAAPISEPVAAPGGKRTRERRSPRLGIVALILSLIAALTAIPAYLAGFQVAILALDEMVARGPSEEFDWSVVWAGGQWVTIVGIAAGVGTVLGFWAFIQGIIAAVKRRGRAAGVFAMIISILALALFAGALYLAVVAGFDAAMVKYSA